MNFYRCKYQKLCIVSLFASSFVILSNVTNAYLSNCTLSRICNKEIFLSAIPDIIVLSNKRIVTFLFSCIEIYYCNFFIHIIYIDNK